MPSLATRAARKISHTGFKALGFDDLVWRRIHRRADILHIGTRYGGWPVPVSLLGPDSICYCAGAGEDISFELGLIARFNCHVWGFDPTPRAIRHVADVAGTNPYFHFSPIGLWDKTDTVKFYAPANPAFVSHSILNLQNTTSYFEAPVRRLGDIMHQNGHGRLDVLKLDIEGAEYKVLDSILADGLDIGVICVEFDEALQPLDSGARKRITTHVDRLLAHGYRLIDAETRGNYAFLKD